MSAKHHAGHRLQRAILVGLVGACTPLFAGSCQSATGETLGGTFCTFQQTLDCATDAGCKGTSTCLPDLSGYGPCVCGDGGVTDASQGAAP